MRITRLSIALSLMMAAGAVAAAPPTKAQAVKALKKASKDVKSASQVFADLGDGRFPVLFVKRGRHCIERMIEKEKEQNCSPTSLPYVALLKRDDKGELQLEGELALPTAAAPWDQPEELKWGIAQVKDQDGDGKPELLVIYGYHGPTEWAVGDIYYRDLALLNLDPPKVAVHVTLDQKPQSSGESEIESKFKFVAAELQLMRRVGDYDGDKGERVAHESKQVWRWDPARDEYLEVKAPKK
jgi:hypothetical protein